MSTKGTVSHQALQIWEHIPSSSRPVTSPLSGKLGKAEGSSESTASDTRQTGSLPQTHLCLWVGLPGTATRRN